MLNLEHSLIFLSNLTRKRLNLSFFIFDNVKLSNYVFEKVTN